MKAKYIEWRPDLTAEEQAQLDAYEAEQAEATRRYLEGYTLVKGVKVPNINQQNYDPRNPAATVIPELGYDPWRHHSAEEWEAEREEFERRAAAERQEAERRAAEERRLRDPVVVAERELAGDAEHYARFVRKNLRDAGVRLQYAMRKTPDGVDVSVFPVGMPIPPPYTKIRASEAQDLSDRVVNRYGHGYPGPSRADRMNWIISRGVEQHYDDFRRVAQQNRAEGKYPGAPSAAVAPAPAPVAAPVRDVVVMSQAQLDRMVPR